MEYCRGSGTGKRHLEQKFFKKPSTFFLLLYAVCYDQKGSYYKKTNINAVTVEKEEACSWRAAIAFTVRYQTNVLLLA